MRPQKNLNALNSLASPLYLQHSSATRLDLDTNHRLRIERKHQPERRIPLHHISRIVCSSQLDITTRALLACLQGGIPVCFVNTDGSALGWCLGTRRKESSLRQLLTHALDDPDWNHLYQPWLQLQRSALAAQTLLLCGVATTPAARHNPKAALCNAHTQKHQVPCAAHIQALSGLAQQEIANYLNAEIGDPTLLAWHQPGLNLLQDLGQLLALHTHTDLHHASQLPPLDGLHHWAVRLHECHSAHWQQRVAHLTHAFEQFLRSHWQ